MQQQKHNRALLVILDGWGLGPDPKRSAIAQAQTPFVNSLSDNWPQATLRTDGPHVGLPEGQMGNSEVGHLNIGAGRVVYQELLRIHRAIEDGSFFENKVLLDAIGKQSGDLHFMGLVSDGGVHSHINHLKALGDLAHKLGRPYFVHAFLDGRDTDPRSGEKYLEDLLPHLEKTGGKLASIVGRYYAMDRDHRWERIRKAYNLLCHGKGKATKNPLEALKESYATGITDEFVKPILISDEQGQPNATIKDGDQVLCFNFRTDRCRQISQVLTQADMEEESMKTLDLHYVTMTRYDEKFKNIGVVFEKDDLKDTLGETLAKAGRTQIRIAETEKYPHVSFFFSGGREESFEGEQRLMAPSPKVATYDLQPQMSAVEVTEMICSALQKDPPDFVCLNFANADMVGHTGDFQAAITACETVDRCLEKLCKLALSLSYKIIVTADHGNADMMINEDGSPNTAHTTNPVPIWLLDPDKEHTQIKSGKLGDLAPTLLKLMDLDVPELMTGDTLCN
jgi:2,3-bisphosphoglycerate-independent phosphoglycerate mutase